MQQDISTHSKQEPEITGDGFRMQKDGTSALESEQKKSTRFSLSRKFLSNLPWKRYVVSFLLMTGIITVIFALIWLLSYSLGKNTYVSGPVKGLGTPLLSEIFMKSAVRYEERYKDGREWIRIRKDEERLEVGFSKLHSRDEIENEENSIKAARFRGQALYAQIAGFCFCILFSASLLLQFSEIWRNWKDSKLYFPTCIAFLLLGVSFIPLIYLGGLQGRNWENALQYGENWKRNKQKLQQEMIEFEVICNKTFEKARMEKARMRRR